MLSPCLLRLPSPFLPPARFSPCPTTLSVAWIICISCLSHHLSLFFLNMPNWHIFRQDSSFSFCDFSSDSSLFSNNTFQVFWIPNIPVSPHFSDFHLLPCLQEQGSVTHSTPCCGAWCLHTHWVLSWNVTFHWQPHHRAFPVLPHLARSFPNLNSCRCLFLSYLRILPHSTSDYLWVCLLCLVGKKMCLVIFYSTACKPGNSHKLGEVRIE